MQDFHPHPVRPIHDLAIHPNILILENGFCPSSVRNAPNGLCWPSRSPRLSSLCWHIRLLVYHNWDNAQCIDYTVPVHSPCRPQLTNGKSVPDKCSIWWHPQHARRVNDFLYNLVVLRLLFRWSLSSCRNPRDGAIYPHVHHAFMICSPLTLKTTMAVDITKSHSVCKNIINRKPPTGIKAGGHRRSSQAGFRPSAMKYCSCSVSTWCLVVLVVWISIWWSWCCNGRWCTGRRDPLSELLGSLMIIRLKVIPWKR